MKDSHDDAPKPAALTAQERAAKAHGLPREVWSLFDRYVHGQTDRRGFLEGAAKFAVAGMTAAGMLDLLTPRFAEAQKVPAEDARIAARYVELASPNGYGTARAYLVKPASASAKLPVVVVAHENRGLNPHIEDIARRLALEGFIALAPDALFPLGGYPDDEDRARTLFTQLDQAKTHQDFLAAAEYARTLPEGTGAVGAVGFCYGGEIANFLAANVPTLRAAAPYYGAPAELAKVPQIRAELQLHFASRDARINDMFPPYEAALKAAGVTYEAFTYPDTDHGFNNDTTPRFDQAAADLAWSRTLALFRRTLADAPAVGDAGSAAPAGGDAGAAADGTKGAGSGGGGCNR